MLHYVMNVVHKKIVPSSNQYPCIILFILICITSVLHEIGSTQNNSGHNLQDIM